MDLQRTLLIVGLAVVSYMMILQWQEDYGSQPVAQQIENNPQSYPQVAKQADDAVIANNPALPDSNDLPKINQIVTKNEPTESVVSSSQNQLIEVITDIFRLKINPVGGDIVSVQLLDYSQSIEAKQIPFTLLSNNQQHIYIAQSGLIGTNGPDASPDGRPIYQSTKQQYQMGEADKLVVDLQLKQASGVLITKRFTFIRDNYLINVDYHINNQSSKPWQAAMFGQIKRDGSKDPGLQSSSGFGLPTFLGAAYWDEEKPYNKLSFDDIDDEQLKKTIPGGWLAMIQHYFMSAWIPDHNNSQVYQTRKVQGNYIIGFTGPIVTVPANAEATIPARFYAGPKILKDLENIENAEGIDLAVDYGPLFFISKPLFWMLDFFHGFTGNWGIAIILLTLLVKLAFFPLSAASYRSMANMRRVQPKLQSLKERYGDDRQKMSQEMMRLYKEEKINPLGGCLPILVQMPVFLALYWALLESVELRQAPFFLWIQDLSVMDPYFILPLIMGATMYFQQLLNPAPPDPMQAKMMRLMPVIFTVFFLWFPAGLVLYWVTNNLLSIAQQWYITRKITQQG